MQRYAVSGVSPMETLERQVKVAVAELQEQIRSLNQDRAVLIEFIAYADAASPEVHKLLTGFKARARLLEDKK